MSRVLRQQAQDQGARVASVARQGEDSAPAPWALAGAPTEPYGGGAEAPRSHSRDLHT